MTLQHIEEKNIKKFYNLNNFSIFVRDDCNFHFCFYTKNESLFVEKLVHFFFDRENSRSGSFDLKLDLAFREQFFLNGAKCFTWFKGRNITWAICHFDPISLWSKTNTIVKYYCKILPIHVNNLHSFGTKMICYIFWTKVT
jgi:hypothetical protein